MQKVLGSFRMTLLLVVCLVGAFFLTKTEVSPLPQPHPVGPIDIAHKPITQTQLANMLGQTSQATDNTGAQISSAPNASQTTNSGQILQTAGAETASLASPAIQHVTVPTVQKQTPDPTPRQPLLTVSPNQPVCVNISSLGLPIYTCINI